MNTSRNLLVRCDASVSMGTGHVMRCLALAQAWQDAGGSVTFAMAETTPAVEARLNAEGSRIVHLPATGGSAEDAAQTATLARNIAAAWIVVDGYQFKSEYQSTLRSEGHKVLFLDDNGDAFPYTADVVLNQSAHATEQMYGNRAAHTRLLLGTRYVLLRREFRAWRGWRRKEPDVANRILVTMGGSDPDNLTVFALDCLAAIRIKGLKVLVIAGGCYPHMSALQHFVEEHPADIELIYNVASMPEIMAKVDLALIAAGGTLWELLFMGRPVASFARSPVQCKIIQCLENDNTVLNLSHAETDKAEIVDRLREAILSQNCRLSLSEHGRGLVEGYGAENVVKTLSQAGSNP